MQLDKGCEGGVDLAFGASLHDKELHSLRTRRILHVSDHALDLRMVRVHANTLASGTSSDSSSSRLGVSSAIMTLTPVTLPPGRARLATSPAAARSYYSATMTSP